MGRNRIDSARWLKRLLVNGIERRHWWKLTEQYNDPDDLGQQTPETLAQIGGLSIDTARRLRQGAPDHEVEAELDRIEESDAQLLTRFDPEFPALLNRMSVPPTALYVAGRVDREDVLAVAVVGPRQPSHYGREMAFRISQGLARVGLTVVSGFAVGIDAVAHRAALQSGGRTLGVLGCGLAVAYPSGHGGIRRDILAADRGALISEYPMTAPPLAGHFPPRNSLIAGLSQAVIVVEASVRSGALVTARAAIEENRYVFAVPGDATRETSRGANDLLRQGAAALCSVSDLLEDLKDVLQHTIDELEAGEKLRRQVILEIEDDMEPSSQGNKRSSAEHAASEKRGTREAPTDPEERLIIDRIAQDPMVPLDTLMADLVPEPFDIGRLSALLLRLELSGRIRQLPGKTYVAV